MQKILLLSALLTFTSVFSQNLPNAMETAGKMTIGWNLGNTLEAIGGETAWGNPLTTQRLIDSVKAAGFNTIRIPCSWDIHANQSDLKIDQTWMGRVKQVVDYCISRDLYVILNIHWDNGWLENNCTESAKNAVNIKQKAYWTQIASFFRNYDGHLLFAGANEPNVEDAGQMAVLLSYHQTFVDAVRATGGNNSSRVLIVQGPATDIEKTSRLMNTLPNDIIADRLMVEVHYYTPYNFCLMAKDEDWGRMFYYWGRNFHSQTDPTRNATYGEEQDVEKLFGMMYEKFISAGIPVIIGEFAANKRISLTGGALALHTASREYFYEYIAEAASRYKMPLVYWDPGYLGDNSSTLFNRNSGAITDRGAVQALMQGSGILTGAESTGSETEEQLIYPNPFTGSLTLNFNQDEEIERIVISDITGNKVEEQIVSAAGREILTGSFLKPGQYFVKLHFRDKVKTIKVIKK